MSTQSSPSRGGRTVLGLLSDPGLPTELAQRLARELPGLLSGTPAGSGRSGSTTPSSRWTRTVPCRWSTSGARRGRGRSRRGGAVTDLPRRAGAQPVVADAATRERVGLVSLPALGALAQYRRVRDTVLRLVAGYLLPGEGHAEAQGRTGAAGPLTSIDPERGEGVRHRLGRRRGRGRRAAGPVGDARARALLAGMVRANPPWRLVPSLSPALAAAAAGAAFGIFYPTSGRSRWRWASRGWSSSR